jgi:hypothetical protein
MYVRHGDSSVPLFHRNACSETNRIHRITTTTKKQCLHFWKEQHNAFLHYVRVTKTFVCNEPALIYIYFRYKSTGSELIALQTSHRRIKNVPSLQIHCEENCLKYKLCYRDSFTFISIRNLVLSFMASCKADMIICQSLKLNEPQNICFVPQYY